MFKPGDTGGTTSSPVDLLFRTGMLIPFAGAVPPSGWLLADGSVVSQITYAALFAVCGTAFNTGGEPVGDFRLPNPISRSVMGAGITAGLTAVAIGEKKGEETHVLLTGELATHSHGVTDPGHNHTQNAHTHTVTDAGHNHTQNAHTHTVTDPGHNHTQNAHTHTQNAHGHNIINPYFYYVGGGTSGDAAMVGANSTTKFGSDQNWVTSSTAVNQNTTATNIANTTGITNANATATNISNTTGVTNQNSTATNISNITGITTNNEGSNTGHNTIHPVLGMTYIIKY